MFTFLRSRKDIDKPIELTDDVREKVDLWHVEFVDGYSKCEVGQYSAVSNSPKQSLTKARKKLKKHHPDIQGRLVVYGLLTHAGTKPVLIESF